MDISNLETLGWSPELTEAFAPYAAEGLVPARVSARHRSGYLVFTAPGEIPAEVSGKMRHEAEVSGFPAVGDWVAARLDGGRARIEAILPRRSVFERSGADPTRPGSAATVEVVAANVDVVFIVTGALDDLNLRRLERYLAAAWESGAQPTVVVTKVDLVEDPDSLIALVQAVSPGAPVLAVSNVTGEGVESVRALIGPGCTAAFLGSSGVGKSSLVNRLLGHDRQAVAGVRADGRGRHTTTSRELLPLASGGLVLDTPGMRLITPTDDAGLEAAFSDVETLARACRFTDCTHAGEPGCAVGAAVQQGLLARERVEGWRKLGRELAHTVTKDDPTALAERRRKWKVIHKANRNRDRARWSKLE